MMTSARFEALPRTVMLSFIIALGAGCDPSLWQEILERSPRSPDGGTVFDGGASGPAHACRCTRRLMIAPGHRCPPGGGESAMAVIGPAGGTLSLKGTQGIASGVDLELVVPEGALAVPTKVTVVELTSAPPGQYVDWSPLYRFEPQGLVLQVPARLRMPWSNTDGLVDADLAIRWSTDGGASFVSLPSNYVNAGFNQATIDRLGVGFVGSSPAAAGTACQSR